MGRLFESCCPPSRIAYNKDLDFQNKINIVRKLFVPIYSVMIMLTAKLT